MKRIVQFLLLVAVWVLLVWPFDVSAPELAVPDLLAGLLAAVLAVTVMRPPGRGEGRPLVAPMRLVWLFAYLAVLAGYIVAANIDVAYRVIHPLLPIRPGIVKVKTGLITASARAVLANSITLTPGTLTVDVLQDGTMYIHWIYVKSEDMEAATQSIVGRFEWFLKRIFE